MRIYNLMLICHLKCLYSQQYTVNFIVLKHDTMKAFFVFALSLLAHSLFAKSISNDFYTTWVTCKVTYQNGAPLPDENPLKYSYIKYKFTKGGRAEVSTIY